MACDGGYAEYMKVPALNLYKEMEDFDEFEKN